MILNFHSITCNIDGKIKMFYSAGKCRWKTWRISAFTQPHQLEWVIWAL